MLPATRVASGQRSQASQIPAAIKGINAIRSLARMEPDECIYTYNLLPEDFGMEVRDGYVEWAKGWAGGAAKTTIPYEGILDSDDKLFVASAEGVFDVTAEGTIAPVQVVTFPSSGGNAGVCSYVQYVNDAGASFLLLCDEQNGYYTFEGATNTWLKVAPGVGAGEIDGVDPADFHFVMVWKNRVWFIEGDSTRAWYLDPGSIYGTATEFNFGTQIRSGGNLRMLVNWTIDGGEGIDDYLVAVSGGGDVSIYQGTDPAQASTFGSIGAWEIGKVPAGRRFATSFGGEVYLLSVYGLLPLSMLLNGSGPEDPTIYATNKISPYLRNVMDEVQNEFGWHVHVHPKQALLFINSPSRAAFSRPPLAFTMYFGHMSWGMVRGLDKADTANWQGEVFWTDSQTNKLYIQRGNVDKVYIDPETDGEPQAIEWDMLSAYQHLGEPARYKRCQFIRPMFVGGGVPAFNVQARYDYDTSELTQYPILGPSLSGHWNSGLWGISLWAGGIQTSDNPRGANGLGRHIAIAIKGRSSDPITLVAFDLTYDFGGLM